ncbi:MAG: nucleotidyltransferase domain-containing protein [Bacteroidia bacterium]
MIYGLQDEVVETILTVFRTHTEVEKVILYGSRAKGNFKPASDVDLTLMGESLDLTILNQISWELDDLLLPFIFDLSIYQYLTNQDLLDHIDRIGIVLFER